MGRVVSPSSFFRTGGGSQRPRRRRLLKKHPNAPKRNKTAYIIFTEAKRQEIKATLPPDAQSVGGWF